MTQRNYLWDNFKALLIFTVVVGHFLETFPLNSNLSVAVDYWIYTFHMPAFLFVSGYLGKSYCKNSKVRAEKIGCFATYYVVFQLIFFVEIWLLDPRKKFSLFEPNIGLWYLIAVIVYYMVIPLFEKIKWFIGLPVLAFIGLAIGCESEAGTFLSISRTFVFAPFFFAGYYMPERILVTLRAVKLRIILGVGSAIASVAIWGAIILVWTSDILPMNVFYGKNNYDSMGFSDTTGVVLRLIAWTISTLMVFALILLMTEKKNLFTYVGQRTLQIYLFHFILIIFFKKTSFTQGFCIDSIWDTLILCVVGVAFTLLLSLKPFCYPFKWMQRLVDRVFNVKVLH